MNSATAPGLLDTGVLTACLRGHPPATRFFIAVNRLGAPQFSRLTALELLAGCRTDPERALALRFIGSSQVLELTDPVMRRAVDLLTTIPMPTTLTPSDAIVAATAIEHALPLYTLDPARFATVPGLATIRPY